MVTGIAFLTFAAFGTQSAMAATATVNLGTSSAYAVLAGSAITNTGPTVVSGDIGISPGTSISGFPPGTQSSGTTQVADGASLAQAMNRCREVADKAARELKLPAEYGVVAWDTPRSAAPAGKQ